MAEEARKAIEKAYEEIQKLAIEELKEESKVYRNSSYGINER